MSEQIRSVHMFGFFKGDDLDRPELPTKAAPSSLTTWEHFERLRRHFARWGDEITSCRTTRTLDGLFVAAEWICPARDGVVHHVKPMWHMVAPPDEIWPDFYAHRSPQECSRCNPFECACACHQTEGRSNVELAS